METPPNLALRRVRGNESPRGVLRGPQRGGSHRVAGLLGALDDDGGDGEAAGGGPFVPAGVALVALAVLDPEEDPGIYDCAEGDGDGGKGGNDEGGDDGLRRAAFRGVLSLPDAFAVPIVRRIYDGRNITEALLNQTYSGAAGNDGLSAERANYLADKYRRPVEEFPEEWDVGLLNVCRANFRDDDAGGGENGGSVRGTGPPPRGARSGRGEGGGDGEGDAGGRSTAAAAGPSDVLRHKRRRRPSGTGEG